MESSFKNEYHKLRLNLLWCSNWLRTEIITILEPFELTQQQLNALRILRSQMSVQNEKTFSTQDLRELMLDKMSDTSRLVDRLVEKKWVIKKTDAADKRRVSVAITQEGLKLLEKVDAKLSEFEDILKEYTLEEVQILNKLLEKMTNKNKEDFKKYLLDTPADAFDYAVFGANI